MYYQQFNQQIKPFIPYLFWALIGVVTYLLLMEQNGKTPSIPFFDKFVHAIIFATLTFTGQLAYKQYQWTLFLGLIAYGALTELLQGTLTLTRYASLYDWFADLTGILVCMLCIQCLKSNAKKNDVS
jgi:VanZ family protein